MEIIVGILFLSNFIFAGIVIHMLRSDDSKKSALKAQKKDAARKYYQAKVLQDISEEIGYSLHIQTVAQMIINSFETLYELTSVSYALTQNRSIVLKTVMKEAVGKKYIDKVNSLTLNSLYTLDESLKGYTTSLTTEQAKDMKSYIALHFDPMPESYFIIPLIVRNTCFGVITIASRNKNAFSQEDMNMVYKVVGQAEHTIERIESLIQSENSRMINLVASLPTPAILFSREEGRIKISAANPIASQILKLPPDPSIDDIVWRMEGNMQLQTLIEEVYQGNKSIFLKEVTLQNRWYKVYVNPVYSISQNEVIGVTLFLLDVTLEIESEKLREKFTNMVVHELRAPMSSIKGGASLLLKGKLSDEDKEKMLHIIADSSERMLMQINDLLDAAKLEAGKFAVAPDAANINEIVTTKVQSLSYLASTKQISLDSDIDSSIPVFNFDKMRIDQVVTNLVSNSLKFTQANGKITIKTEMKDKEVIVSVIDNGMGVPAGKQNLLFVPFSQMQSAFRRDGTGLGLYISRGIIESHGGKIWMKSVEGKGTTVSFSLPMDLEAVVDKPPTPIMPPGQRVIN